MFSSISLHEVFVVKFRDVRGEGICHERKESLESKDRDLPSDSLLSLRSKATARDVSERVRNFVVPLTALRCLDVVVKSLTLKRGSRVTLS